MKRALLPLVVFCVLVGFLFFGLDLKPREVPSPLVGKPVPVFSLATVHQPERKLSPQDLLGTPWVLNVWASWCVSCRAEHPVVLKLAQMKLAPIVGLDYKDQREDALKWLEHFGDPYTVSISDVDGRVGIDFGVYGVPETFVIDKNGIIRHKHIGPLTEDDLADEIVPLLERLR